MLKEGYTLPFQSRPSLTRSPKLSNAMHIFTGTYIGKKHYIRLWTRNGAVEPVQNLCASSTLLGSKTTQPLETYSRSEQTKPFGDHQDHPPTMGVGCLNRFQGRLLPYTYTGTVQDISNVMSRVGHTSSKHCLSVCPLHHGAHCSSKGVETDGHTQGYNNPPVLRRLVGESHIPPGLSPAYTRSSENMPSLGYQFDLMAGRVRPIPDHWQNLQDKY